MSAPTPRCFADFGSYSTAVSERLAAFLTGLADPLGTLAAPLAADYGPQTWTHPYSFPLAHLPLWMLHTAGEARDDSLDAMAVDCGYASCCGYLYIRLQDDVYDEPAGDADARMLLVANELIRECFCSFHRHFPAESEFWRHFAGYWEEFSQATLWELQHCVGRWVSSAPGNVMRRGRKLSLAKAPCAAVALALGLGPRLSDIEIALERLQAANQLANDVAGLVRDIDSRHVTYPLSLATGAEFDWEAPDRRERALAAVMQSTAVEDTFALAASLHDDALAAMDGLASPCLDEFVRWRKGFLSAGLNDYAGLKAAGLLGMAE